MSVFTQGVRRDAPLYPPIEPTHSGMLPLDDLHIMHWEQTGNAAGPALLIIHGGPGAGITPYYRQIADPTFYRIVLWDQRGCGKSTPFAEIRQNTTQDLIADMERLRRHLNVDRWIVCGASWGSTLAIAYAEAHPESCAGIIVSAIYLARKKDGHWWWNGMHHYFPEAWAALEGFLPPEERGDVQAAYIRRCTSSDPEIAEAASWQLALYEIQTVDFLPNWERLRRLRETRQFAALARIEMAYKQHSHFFRPNQLLEDIGRIRHIPGKIITGRYDVCTPPMTAYALHEAWPEAEFVIAPEANHAWSDLNMSVAMVRATNDFKQLFPEGAK